MYQEKIDELINEENQEEEEVKIHRHYDKRDPNFP